MLAAAVLLRDREVVLERGVRAVERVGELVAVEHVILGAGRADVASLGVDGAADRPEAAFLALDPDHDRLRIPGVVDPVEHPLREPAAVGRGPHDLDYTIGPVAGLATYLRDLLFGRSTKEQRVAEYVIREHAAGRRLEEILQDHYVQNRLSPVQQARLIERQDVINAVSTDDLVAARDYLTGVSG
jgi:hypothetical protein